MSFLGRRSATMFESARKEKEDSLLFSSTNTPNPRLNLNASVSSNSGLAVRAQSMNTTRPITFADPIVTKGISSPKTSIASNVNAGFDFPTVSLRNRVCE